MEENLKRDVIREVRAGHGRILLHDEVEERPNVFSIIPLWETVSEEDIMTPGDVFKLMTKEGYNVSIRPGKVALISDILPRRSTMAALLLCVEGLFLIVMSLTSCRQMNRPLCPLPCLSSWKGSLRAMGQQEITSSIVRWVVGGRPQAWSLPV
jgi:Inositol hexakisphosphate